MGETSGSIPDRPTFLMTQPYKLERQFVGVSYPTFESLARHAEQLNGEILAIPATVRIYPLSEFAQRVAEIAPRHQTYRGTHYNVRTITAELLASQGVTSPSKQQFRKKIYLVSNALEKLRKRGIIPKGELKKKPPLREPTDELQERFSYLVGTESHRHRRWHNLLGDRLSDVVRDGLTEAIMHAPSLEKQFNYFATMVIRRRITDAARSALVPGKRKNEVQFVEGEGADAGKLDLEKQRLRDEFNALHSLHRRGIIKPSHLMLWTLKHIYGHRQSRIAKRFGIDDARVIQILGELGEKLKQA